MASAQALVRQTPAILATMTTGTRCGNTCILKPAASTTSAAPPPPKRRRVEGTVSLDFLLGCGDGGGSGGYNHIVDYILTNCILFFSICNSTCNSTCSSICNSTCSSTSSSWWICSSSTSGCTQTSRGRG